MGVPTDRQILRLEEARTPSTHPERQDVWAFERVANLRCTPCISRQDRVSHIGHRRGDKKYTKDERHGRRCISAMPLTVLGPVRAYHGPEEELQGFYPYITGGPAHSRFLHLGLGGEDESRASV